MSSPESPPAPPFSKGGVSHPGHEACTAATELPVSFPPLKKEPWPPNFPPLKKGGQGGFAVVQQQTLIEARERLARDGVPLEGGEDE